MKPDKMPYGRDISDALGPGIVSKTTIILKGWGGSIYWLKILKRQFKGGRVLTVTFWLQSI